MQPQIKESFPQLWVLFSINYFLNVKCMYNNKIQKVQKDTSLYKSLSSTFSPTGLHPFSPIQFCVHKRYIVYTLVHLGFFHIISLAAVPYQYVSNCFILASYSSHIQLVDSSILNLMLLQIMLQWIILTIHNFTYLSVYQYDKFLGG